METEIIEKPDAPKKKKGFIALILFIAAFIIYYMVMSMLAPARKINKLSEQYGFRQDSNNLINDTILTDSAYLALFREKSFMQSKVAMAETDSIALSINLPDSTVTLEICGVAVSTAKLSGCSAGRMFRDRYGYLISSLLSRPLEISRNYSSIPKEQLMIKMAPKDTSEYVPDIIPDTADYEPVNFIMETKDGIVVHIYQQERLKWGDGLHLFFFDFGFRMRSAARDLKSIITFKVPEYRPYIKIRLPRTSAKIIYRALPSEGQIAVRL